MALYLVTGGAGFIGSTIARELLRRGERVRVVDNFSTGKRANLAEIISDIDLIEGDLADLRLAERAVKGADFVLHQAALPSVPRSILDPIGSNRSNIDATLNVLVAARDAHVGRVVFASSSSVYGDTEVLPKVETMRENPISPYALTKLAGEKYCAVFTRAYGLPTVALRYFNIFGPRQDPSSQYSGVISKFTAASLNETPVVVYGDGNQSRDFTYVDNAVQANLLACEAPGVAGMAFNIGMGGRHSLNELLEQISSIAGRKLEVSYASPRAGDVLHSEADITRAQQLLGYRPSISFEEGLRRTIEWCRENTRSTEAAMA